MRYAKLNDMTYLLRLERGEKVQSSISFFCNHLSIRNATLWGIGSVEELTLAHYKVNTKQYVEKKMDGIFEVTNLSGTIAQSDGGIFIHAHATVSDESMSTFGGHLVEATVSATVEIVLTDYPTSHRKVHDDAIGLKVWDLEGKL